MSEVIYYTSDEVGAPAMTNAAGAQIGVLDACLVNGFNAKSVLSAAVASGVCTLQVSAHGYTNGRKLTVAGFDTVALNGVKKLTVVDSNHVSFLCPGVADQTATGTATVKRAPLGWTKTFGSTTQGIYSRSDVAATAYKLRVDNTLADGTSRVSGVLAPTDFNTNSEQFPLTAQTGTGVNSAVWRGCSGATAKTWALVGDGTSFYFFSDFDSPTHYYNAKGFGDLVSLKPGDTGNCFIGAETFTAYGQFLGGAPWGSAAIPIPPNGAGWVARDYTGIAHSIAINNVLRGAYPMGSVNSFVFPSPVNNGLLFDAQAPVMEASVTLRAVLRGYYPGVAEPLSAIPVTFQGATFPVGGKDYAALVFHTAGDNNLAASGLFDLTGPWQ